jgi:prepilin-type N-terminal cleavage/methylation domain-containing protein
MSRLRRSARLRPESQQGLTAVELMVVLAIVALLALAAYPQISTIRQVMVSKGAAEQVGSATRQARQYAITNGTNYCIKFQAVPSHQYSVGPTDDSTSADCTLSSTTLTEKIGDGQGSAVVSPNNAAIIFDPIGNVLNQGATTPYVIQLGVDTQPASCASTVGVTLYGGVRVIKC